MITYFQIDFLITGLIEEKMLNQLPKEIRIFSLNALALENQINLVEFFIRHKEIEVFQSVYSAVLATSVFPDWTASMALRLVNAEIKFLFLVDESLSNTT